MNRKKEKNQYPNKAYKIHPLYIRMFNACLSLFERDMFTESLIKHYFKFEQISELPRCTKPELLEMMIRELQKSSKNKPNIYTQVFQNERVQELRKIYLQYINETDNKIWREVFNARISIESKGIIENLAENTETIGEVIELSISHFISDCTDVYYELIKFSFETQIKSEYGQL